MAWYGLVSVGLGLYWTWPKLEFVASCCMQGMQLQLPKTCCLARIAPSIPSRSTVSQASTVKLQHKTTKSTNRRTSTQQSEPLKNWLSTITITLSQWCFRKCCYIPNKKRSTRMIHLWSTSMIHLWSIETPPILVPQCLVWTSSKAFSKVFANRPVLCCQASWATRLSKSFASSSATKAWDPDGMGVSWEFHGSFYVFCLDDWKFGSGSEDFIHGKDVRCWKNLQLWWCQASKTPVFGIPRWCTQLTQRWHQDTGCQSL